MSFTEQQQLDMLVRDLTSVSFPKAKSEARRRINELLDARTRTILIHLKMLPDITYYGKPSSKQKVIQYIKAQFLTTKPNE